MSKTATISSVKRILAKYKEFLLNGQRFQLKPAAFKAECMNSITGMENAIESNNVPALWEAAIDHMFTQDWDPESGPTLWQELYAQIDDYRSECGVDSTCMA